MYILIWNLNKQRNNTSLAELMSLFGKEIAFKCPNKIVHAMLLICHIREIFKELVVRWNRKTNQLSRIQVFK